jgi:hypothetical protein
VSTVCLIVETELPRVNPERFGKLEDNSGKNTLPNYKSCKVFI